MFSYSNCCVFSSRWASILHPSQNLRHHSPPRIRHNDFVAPRAALPSDRDLFLIVVSIPTRERGTIFSQREILSRPYEIDNESCVPTHTFLVWTAHHHPRERLRNCEHLFTMTAAQQAMCTVPQRGPPILSSRPHPTKSLPRFIVYHKLRGSWLL